MDYTPVIAVVSVLLLGAIFYLQFRGQARLIENLMRQNADLTLKLMSRDLVEYVDARSAIAETDVLPEIETTPPHPNPEPPRASPPDPREFPEELVGTVSGEEPMPGMGV